MNEATLIDEMDAVEMAHELDKESFKVHTRT